MPDVQYLTTAEVAARLKVHPRTVLRWIEAGILTPSVTLPGGAKRFTEDDLAALTL